MDHQDVAIVKKGEEEEEEEEPVEMLSKVSERIRQRGEEGVHRCVQNLMMMTRNKTDNCPLPHSLLLFFFSFSLCVSLKRHMHRVSPWRW